MRVLWIFIRASGCNKKVYVESSSYKKCFTTTASSTIATFNFSLSPLIPSCYSKLTWNEIKSFSLFPVSHKWKCTDLNEKGDNNKKHWLTVLISKNAKSRLSSFNSFAWIEKIIPSILSFNHPRATHALSLWVANFLISFIAATFGFFWSS